MATRTSRGKEVLILSRSGSASRNARDKTSRSVSVLDVLETQQAARLPFFPSVSLPCRKLPPKCTVAKDGRKGAAREVPVDREGSMSALDTEQG
ncbi:hypothetical protein KC357_g295 [Hortaea werneckii]|nr:hypothetical protein KC357_g295 [Hortaea werneckii]